LIRLPTEFDYYRRKPMTDIRSTPTTTDAGIPIESDGLRAVEVTRDVSA